MALFARRVVQERLNLLRQHVLTPAQAQRLAGQLNKPSHHVISTEWEVVVLAAFAKQTLLRYEPTIGAGLPDICIEDAGEDKDVTFIAEITTVSDRGTDENNPADYLYERILMMALKLDIDFARLKWHVGDRMEGVYPNQRVKLMLPRKSAVQSLVQSSIKPFLLCVRANPSERHELVWDEPGVDFRLIYDPGQQQSGFGGHLVATAAYSKTDNSLYAALDRKAGKLSKTKYRGIRGIITGDAGCTSLQTSSGGGGSHDVRAIVTAFLQKHPSVKFVTTSRYEYQSSYMMERGHHLRHSAYFQSDLSDHVRTKLHLFLDEAFADIPKPISSPDNALRDILGRRELDRGSGLGAYEWSPPRKLKIPVRVFLGLVAATLSRRDFEILFHQTMPRDGGPLVHFFNTILATGMPIQNVSVEICPDRDNDWILFDTQRAEPHEARHESKLLRFM